MTRRRLTVTALVCAVAVSCGGDTGGTETPLPKPQPAASGPTFNDWTPASIDRFDVKGDSFGAVWSFCSPWGQRVFMTEVIQGGEGKGAGAIAIDSDDPTCPRTAR